MNLLTNSYIVRYQNVVSGVYLVALLPVHDWWLTDPKLGNEKQSRTEVDLDCKGEVTKYWFPTRAEDKYIPFFLIREKMN